MQRIQIKPDVVMNSSKLLPTSSVANIQDDLTRVRARLDHRIRSRHNIDGRLNKVIREIDDIERKMHKIKHFTQQSMERYTQVERDLANRSSRFNRLQSPNLMKRGNWWESYFSSDKKTRNRLINLLFPWLQLTFQRHFGLLYPIGPALSFNKWINPNSPREVSFSDVEKQAIVDYLKRVENGEVPSNMDQYAGVTNSYEGYIGENNIFGQPLGGNAPKNVETVATILDFLPFIGNLKAASEAYLGYDPLTGRKLEDWERGVAAAAILGGGAARIGGKVAPKVVDKVGDLGKGTGKSNLEVHFTKEQLATKPSYSPAPEKWTKKGGTVKIDEKGTWVYTNKKGQTVRYPDGYPDFTPYSHPTVKPVEIDIASPTNRPLDYKNANKKAGLNKDSDPPVSSLNEAPEGYTWHHHQDGKTMILVDKKVHREFTHSGGVSNVNGK